MFNNTLSSTYDRYKFSRQYPVKFNKPGHNLPMVIIQETIENPHYQEASRKLDKPARSILITNCGDGKHENCVVVSAFTSAGNFCARIISAYERTKTQTGNNQSTRLFEVHFNAE